METARLVKRCQAGDREAFGTLYLHYAPSMLRGIYAHIHDRDTAQDILHDGFIIALSAIDGLNDASKFESWLSTIMRNLALRHIRDIANRSPLPINEMSTEAIATDETSTLSELTWDELDHIIDKLPRGYNRVFRLAVLDGLSHKEIGELLGIAPHSSSSQLSHAKAMLRRLITEHRLTIGTIGILVIIIMGTLVRLNHNRRYEPDNGKIASNGPDITNRQDLAEPLSELTPAEETEAKPSAIISHECRTPMKENVVKEEISVINASTAPGDDKEMADSAGSTPNYFPPTPHKDLLTGNDAPLKVNRPDPSGWSIALTYSGNMGQTTADRYRIPVGPDPDLPSEAPEETEVTVTTRHHTPLTVGVALNHSLTDRWGVETGVRYTLLRSDILQESEIEATVTRQRIHYVGIPLKFNYRIIGNERFTLYIQGGGALDIPVSGAASFTQWQQGGARPEQDRLMISAPLQWSVETGAGIEYHLTPSLGIYAEPSVRYYFNHGSGIRTIRQDKPLEFTVPIGIRVDW